MLVKREKDLIILQLEGEITFGNCLRMKESLKALFEEGDRYIVIDISKVSFMDSSGLGMLVSILKMTSERHGKLVLAAPQMGIRRLFHMTRMDQIIDLCETVDDGIQHMKE